MEIEKRVDFVADELVKKLILLFIFDKMEFPLTDASINRVIAENESWMNYMEFIEARSLLEESKYIYRANAENDTSFRITQDGRGCLSHFFHKIPASIREEITEYAKENRQKFKRSQEYTNDYFKNADGTHTVVLRIKDMGSANDNLLEIRFKTSTRVTAKAAVTRWKSKAAIVYDYINHIMLDEDDHKEDNK